MMKGNPSHLVEGLDPLALLLEVLLDDSNPEVELEVEWLVHTLLKI